MTSLPSTFMRTTLPHVLRCVYIYCRSAWCAGAARSTLGWQAQKSNTKGSMLVLCMQNNSDNVHLLQILDPQDQHVEKFDFDVPELKYVAQRSHFL